MKYLLLNYLNETAMVNLQRARAAHPPSGAWLRRRDDRLAFLIAPSTMSQRLVRAKSRIRQAGNPFRVPERDELAGRLHAVLEAIYATYVEGWSDPAPG